MEILCENGYQVDVVSPLRKNIPQSFACQGGRLNLLDNPAIEVGGPFVLLAGKEQAPPDQLLAMIRQLAGGYDLVIGVDRSIVEAAMIASVLQIPLGLFSYEIFFAEEAGAEFKQPEIQACQNLAFAVCPDSIRAGHLCRENQIPLQKIITIPVAGRGIVERRKSDYLHQKFGISSDKKIALYTGSVAGFCMSEELLQSVSCWPQDWVLVMHNRHGLDSNTSGLYSKYGSNPNIYFSCEPREKAWQMRELYDGADLGADSH